MLIRRAIESDFESIWEIFKAVVEPGDSYVFNHNIDREDGFSYWFGAGITTYVAEEETGQIVLFLFHILKGNKIIYSEIVLDSTLCVSQ